MQLHEALESLAGVSPADFGKFRQHIDPAWVEEALVATGTASVRRRRLPADQVLWLVIGMALMRNESIERVVSSLDLALPSSSGTNAARSGIAQARKRLGEDPLAYLFYLCAAQWAHDQQTNPPWRKLSLYAVDGTTLRVPDSKENWEAFGGSLGSGQRNGSAYPTVRLAALMALHSRSLAAVHFDDYTTGELTLVGEFWHELPDNSLVIVDRNFLVAGMLNGLVQSGTNRNWLTRAKSTTRLRTVKRLGKNDELVEIQLSDATRRANPNIPEVWLARAIKYQRKGFRPSILLSSLLDPKEYPSEELVGLYHGRWEIELAYDEVKTHMLDRQESIRSRTPAGVRQEIWGILLAYNLIRLEMARAARAIGVEPNRISFVAAVSMIRNAWILWSTPPMAPGRIPEGLLDLRRNLGLLLLPPRRPERAFPRAVKIKMSSYNRKASTRDARK